MIGLKDANELNAVARGTSENPMHVSRNKSKDRELGDWIASDVYDHGTTIELVTIEQAELTYLRCQEIGSKR